MSLSLNWNVQTTDTSPGFGSIHIKILNDIQLPKLLILLYVSWLISPEQQAHPEIDRPSLLVPV